MSEGEFLRPRRALLSVSDKSGLAEFGRALAAAGSELVSTGGTASALRDAGLQVRDVAEITGFPEMMDGRVKTLHPMVHGGLLADRDDATHREAMAAHGIGGIDLLVVNLYPFERAAASGAGFATCMENIDVGGPAMIRAAAKNHRHVAVVTDPSDYAPVGDALADKGLSEAFRRRLAAKAFARTAAYDAAISTWFADAIDDPMPERLTLAAQRRAELRYGENPHQRAAFYVMSKTRPGVATAALLQGKALSYNNLNDTNAAYELAAELSRLDQPAVTIIKHANPCGAAIGATLAEAHARALACDPVSAFGGVVAVNRPLDETAAAAILEVFTEVVIAPEIADGARMLFAAKPDLRLLEAGGLPDPSASGFALKPLSGGFLVQDRDSAGLDFEARCVTKRAPSEAELSDLRFAWLVAKHVASNAIVFARGGAAVGIGAGQMSRIDSTRVAACKAAEAGASAGRESLANGAVVASDAFYPFADGLIAAAEAGVTAAIQPGGSKRDMEVIEAANMAGMAMLLTGRRHFRH